MRILIKLSKAIYLISFCLVAALVYTVYFPSTVTFICSGTLKEKPGRPQTVDDFIRCALSGDENICNANYRAANELISVKRYAFGIAHSINNNPIGECRLDTRMPYILICDNKKEDEGRVWSAFNLINPSYSFEINTFNIDGKWTSARFGENWQCARAASVFNKNE